MAQPRPWAAAVALPSGLLSDTGDLTSPVFLLVSEIDLFSFHWFLSFCRMAAHNLFL